MAFGLKDRLARQASGNTDLGFDPLGSDESRLVSILLDLVDPDPNQPRKTLGDLSELAASIREHGVINPIIVEVAGSGRYRIIAGERRFAACRSLGLQTVPCIVRTVADNVKSILWPAIKGNGFKDQKLPLDWYQLVKDHYDAVGLTADGTDMALNGFTQIGVGARLDSIKIRIIGGKVLTGDVLFVKALQSYIDQRSAYLSSTVPQMQQVLQRLANEFPDKMEDMILQLIRQYPGQFKEPDEAQGHRLGREEAAKDFNLWGFKTLRMGMSLDELKQLTPYYEIVKEDPQTKMTRVRFTSGEWQSIGDYPLTSLSGDFQNGALIRLSLTFDANRSDIYDLFQKTYGPLEDSTLKWTRNSLNLQAKCSDENSGVVFATILAPMTTDKGATNPAWDEIRFIDLTWFRESLRRR